MADETLKIFFEIEDNFPSAVKRVAKYSDEAASLQKRLSSFEEIRATDFIKDIAKASSQTKNLTQDFDNAVSLIHNNLKASSKNFKSFGGDVKNTYALLDKMAKKQHHIHVLEQEMDEASTTFVQKREAAEMAFIARKKSVGQEALAELEAEHSLTMSRMQKEHESTIKDMYAAPLYAAKQELMGFAGAANDELNKQSKEIKRIFEDDEEHLESLKKSYKDGLGVGGSGLMGSVVSSAMTGNASSVASILGDHVQKAIEIGGKKAVSALEKQSATSQKDGKTTSSGLMKGLGTSLKALGTFAVVAGGIAAVIKLLFDAESQAKDLNKALLDSVPASRLLTGSVKDLETALGQVRDASTDPLENWRLGMKADERNKLFGDLDQHGMHLDRLIDKKEGLNQAAETARRTSLALGVDISEVAKLMGDMSQTLGHDFNEVDEVLLRIQKSARESGISNKRFFGTINQLTAGMGLYGFRLEEVSNILASVNKHMDPESAENFTKSMVQGIDSMDFARRTLMAATLGTDRIGGDLIKEAALQAQRMEGLGDLVSASSPEELAKKISKMSHEEYMELLTEAENKLGADSTRRIEAIRRLIVGAEGDQFQMMEAMSFAGPTQKLIWQMDEVRKFADKHRVSVDGLTTVHLQHLNMTQKQLDEMKAAEIGFNRDWHEFQKDRDAAMEKGDKEALEKLAKDRGLKFAFEEGFTDAFGKEIKDAQSLALAHAGELSDTEKDAMKSEMEQQIDATRKISDALEIGMHALLNNIFGAIVGIRKLLASSSLFGSDSERREVSRLEQEIEGKRQLKLAEDRVLAVMQDGSEEEKKAAQDSLDLAKKSHTALMEQIKEERKNDLDIANTLTSKDGYTTLSGKNLQEETMDSSWYERIPGFRKKDITRSRFDEDQKRKEMLGDPNLYKEDNKLSAMGNYLLTPTSDNILSKKLIDGIYESYQEVMKREGLTEDQRQNKLRELLGDKGIAIDDTTLNNMAEAMTRAMADAEDVKNLRKMGLSDEEAKYAVRARASGTLEQVLPNMFGEDRGKRRAVSKALAPSADARLLTSGMPVLDLKAGDMIIDRESIAKTVRGSAGSMAPDFINQIMKGVPSSSGSGSKPSVMYNTFHINGNNPTEIRNTILEAFDAYERKKVGGG